MRVAIRRMRPPYSTRFYERALSSLVEAIVGDGDALDLARPLPDAVDAQYVSRLT